MRRAKERDAAKCNFYDAPGISVDTLSVLKISFGEQIIVLMTFADSQLAYPR